MARLSQTEPRGPLPHWYSWRPFLPVPLLISHSNERRRSRSCALTLGRLKLLYLCRCARDPRPWLVGPSCCCGENGVDVDRRMGSAERNLPAPPERPVFGAAPRSLTGLAEGSERWSATPRALRGQGIWWEIEQIPPFWHSSEESCATDPTLVQRTESGKFERPLPRGARERFRQRGSGCTQPSRQERDGQKKIHLVPAEAGMGWETWGRE